MKRITCFILVFMLVLGLCACGSTANTARPAEETAPAVTVSPNIISTEVVSGANNAADSGSSEPETVTAKMEDAVASAKNFMSGSSFSRGGMIEQLEYENYTAEEAAYGADHCGADWNAQAAEAAKSYQECLNLSRQELTDLLVSAGFSEAEAEYGASQAVE